MTPARDFSMQETQGTDSITHPRKAHFVSQVVEATNTVLSVLVVVVLHEAESEPRLETRMAISATAPTPCTVRC